MVSLSPGEFLKYLTDRIGPILRAEAEKVWSAPELVDSMQDELEKIKDFLYNEAGENEDKASEGTRKKVRRVREIMFQIEDILDQWNLLQQEQRTKQQYSINGEGDSVESERTDCWAPLELASQWFNYKFPLSIKSEHSIACKVIRTTRAINKITGDGRNYYQSIFQNQDSKPSEPQLTASPHQDPARRPLYRDEFELVGLQVRKNSIIQLLGLSLIQESTTMTMEAAEDSQEYHVLKDDEASATMEMKKNQQDIKYKAPSLLAVWGEPGVGKTTVVHKVFEDPMVRQHFPVRVWITANKRSNRLALLKSLLKQFLLQAEEKSKDTDELSLTPKNVDKLLNNTILITDALRRHLLAKEKRRYLVVLDEVCELDEELSRCLKAALLTSTQRYNGSRILVTTSSQRIANFWKTSWPNGEGDKVKVLTKEEANDLFDKRAFGKRNSCPSKLEEIKDVILEDCQGLPYLIEKVGTQFSTTDKWVELFHRFQSNPLSGEEKSVFLSRYHEMPSHLKLCFLHLSMFPKGYKVDRMRIIRLWIAEGFITSHRRCNTLEEIAEEYLNELVERGMVATKRDETGRNREIQFHRFWHQMVLSMLDDLRFCLVLPQVNKSSNLSYRHEQYRRLSIQEDILEPTHIPSSVRSIFSFVKPKQFPIRWKWPYPDATFLLRVLDLQDAPLKQVPKAVGKLHNLRYLSLRGTQVEEVKEFIGGLWNLQTLDLKYSKVHELPKEISHLEKLRHLLAYEYDDEDDMVYPVKIPHGALARLKNLQKLAYVDAYSAQIVRELKNLNQLRRLAITNMMTEHGNVLCEAIEEMKHLRSLIIVSKEGNDIDLNQLSDSDKCPKFLERLTFDGKLLSGLPDWIPKLRHLVSLRLTGLNKDPLGQLTPLSDLIELELVEYEGKVLDFRNQGFTKLGVLRVIGSDKLKKIQAGKKPLQELRIAALWWCYMLKNDQLPPQITRVLDRGEHSFNMFVTDE